MNAIDAAKAIAMLSQVSAAALTGFMYKKHGMRSRSVSNVRPLDGNTCRMVGRAYTIRYVPQREDLNVATDLGHPDSLLLRAMEEIGEGDVLVMDMQGCAHVGGLGDVLMTRLIQAKAAGVLADGGMRDVGDLKTMGLPIFCTGPAAPPGPVAIMPAGVQELVGCGGVAIFPGDFVVGDDDGAVIVPAHLAIEAAEHCIAKERQDSWSRQMVADGHGVRGYYPPDAERLAQYQAWVTRQQPG